jgi:hypothetical protein
VLVVVISLVMTGMMLAAIFSQVPPYPG